MDPELESRFSRLWDARFPSTQPPKLDCFKRDTSLHMPPGNGDELPKFTSSYVRERFRNELDRCETRIKQIEQELAQQSFIRVFILESLNQYKQNTVPPGSPEDTLDNQERFSTANAGVQVDYNRGSIQQGPVISPRPRQRDSIYDNKPPCAIEGECGAEYINYAESRHGNRDSWEKRDIVSDGLISPSVKPKPKLKSTLSDNVSKFREDKAKLSDISATKDHAPRRSSSAFHLRSGNVTTVTIGNDSSSCDRSTGEIINDYELRPLTHASSTRGPPIVAEKPKRNLSNLRITPKPAPRTRKIRSSSLISVIPTSSDRKELTTGLRSSKSLDLVDDISVQKSVGETSPLSGGIVEIINRLEPKDDTHNSSIRRGLPVTANNGGAYRRRSSGSTCSSGEWSSSTKTSPVDTLSPTLHPLSERITAGSVREAGLQVHSTSVGHTNRNLGFQYEISPGSKTKVELNNNNNSDMKKVNIERPESSSLDDSSVHVLSFQRLKSTTNSNNSSNNSRTVVRSDYVNVDVIQNKVRVENSPEQCISKPRQISTINATNDNEHSTSSMTSVISRCVSGRAGIRGTEDEEEYAIRSLNAVLTQYSDDEGLDSLSLGSSENDSSSNQLNSSGEKLEERGVNVVIGFEPPCDYENDVDAIKQLYSQVNKETKSKRLDFGKVEDCEYESCYSPEYLETDFDVNVTTVNSSKLTEETTANASALRPTYRRRHDYEECMPPGILELSRQLSPERGNKFADIDRGGVGHSSNSPGHWSSDQQAEQSDDDEKESSDETDSATMVTSPEAEKLRLRFLVVKGIMENEQAYLTCLDVVLQYMRSLQAAAASSQPVISTDDTNIIFHNIPELYNIQKEFVSNLQQRVKTWSPLQTVGDLFKILVFQFPIFSEYMSNYQNAVEAIHRCIQDNPTFEGLARVIPVPNSRDTLSLEDMLFKPVTRIQRNTLVLHDLLKYTPNAHPDYNQLERALKLTHHNLESFGAQTEPQHGGRAPQKVESQRYLVKNGFVVEIVSGNRKLRHFFLFNDVIICTKQKVSSRQRYNFECKWFVPLSQLIILEHRTDQQDMEKLSLPDEGRQSNQDNIEDLKRRVSVLKADLRQEAKREQEINSKDRGWSFAHKAISRNIEKLRKKLAEQEGALVLASPSLLFKLYHKQGRTYNLLLSTDYEREEWKESIQTQQTRAVYSSRLPSAYDIQNLLENVKQLPKVNSLGNFLLKIGTDEDVWNGLLNVTIHKMSGLSQPADTHCCLEVDSYGHFFMKARTRVCFNSKQPNWEEDFEIDLDGSQTLRILCYKTANKADNEVLLGKSALELSKSWLIDSFQEKEISMNEISLTVSIRHTSIAKTMKRLPSHLKTGVFGVRISAVTRREGRKIPIVVTTCIEEIETRGLNEVGLYRVSGVTSEVQRLKKIFEKNSRAAAQLISENDIHAVTGLLKLYFRELPQPLFSESLYNSFVDTLGLNDPETKEKCMLTLLHSLPEANYCTIVYLIDHLARVASQEGENKMGINNLATIFGPNLLRPAPKSSQPLTADELFISTKEAFTQSSILLYYLQIRMEGHDLRK